MSDKAAGGKPEDLVKRTGETGLDTEGHMPVKRSPEPAARRDMGATDFIRNPATEPDDEDDSAEGSNKTVRWL